MMVWNLGHYVNQEAVVAKEAEMSKICNMPMSASTGYETLS